MSRNIRTIKGSHKYFNFLIRNYENEILLLDNLPSEEKIKKIQDATIKYEEKKRQNHEYLEKNCDHDILIRVHGSMVTGRTSEYLPNENHICYYCLRCDKYFKEDEIKESSIIIDFFGHEDALLVGYNNSLALVDYLHELAKNCYTDDALINLINKRKEKIKVPEKYIRRK